MHALRRFIEQQMEDNGWTQSDLVRQSGLSKQHLSKMLNDDRERLTRLPSEDTLLGLAQGLRVPLTVVVLRAAQACGVPVDVTEVEVGSARALTTDQLLSEVRRRIDAGEARDGTATNRAGGAGDNVHHLDPPRPPTMAEIESGQAAAFRRRRRPKDGPTGDSHT